MTKVGLQHMSRTSLRGRAFAPSALLLVAALSSCTDTDTSNQPGGPPQAVVLGSSISGLSAAEQEAFERGRAVFEREFKPSEGLGPFYNAVSCRSCHSTPVAGGSSKLYRNFYIARIGNPGEVDLLSLPSPAVPAYGTGQHAVAQFELEGSRTVIPDNFFGQPVTVGQRNAIPIFGVGLFEFVSDATIMAMTDPDDADGDGISGRYNTEGGAIGRFGVKSQANNIESFTRAPLQNQMGITSDPFLGAGGIVSFAAHASAPSLFQGTSSPTDPTSDNDGVADPEISHSDLGDLIAFTRFLAPPEPLTFSAEAVLGEALFDSMGCVKCHVPSLESSRGAVNAYTD
ncbi:MAG: di-heme oxidoredictase family protein, partial [Planctomycetota bacterium]